MRKEMCKINILGSEWKIIECDSEEEDPVLSKNSAWGYASYSTREIVILSLEAESYKKA